MGSPGETLSKRVMPRAIVALSRVTWPARTSAAARRSLQRSARVELYFAFDDPCSAVAALELDRRLAARSVALGMRPVVRRGIPEDPALESKRVYALEDATRRAGRVGLELARAEPVEAPACAFLAEWVAAGRRDGERAGASVRSFCIAALRALWFERDGPELSPAGYEPLWEAHVGGAPPAAGARAEVARNERSMRLHWMYDTPAAWVHGRWYFAHDRPEQICEWLDELGWREP
jgi:hypothetical protein